MNRTYLAILALCSVPFAACAPPGPNTTEAASQGADALSKKPIPFVRQFVGTYYAQDPNADVQALELRATGRYAITFLDGSTESGSYRGPGKPDPAMVLAFITRGHKFTGTFAPLYASASNPTTLHVTRDGVETLLDLDRPADADESLCDATGGQWFDDEADPTTGLFCGCPASAPAFIPSEGGCVH